MPSISPLGVNSQIVKDGKNGAILAIHVQPKAARTCCVGVHGHALKIRIAAPPIDGAANKELIRFLASELSLPTTAVRIESGAGGRQKRVRLCGMSAEQVMARLAQKGTVRE